MSSSSEEVRKEADLGTVVRLFAPVLQMGNLRLREVKSLTQGTKLSSGRAGIHTHIWQVPQTLN